MNSRKNAGALENAVLWLKKLDSEIRREFKSTWVANMSNTEHECIDSAPIRSLTETEWEKVKKLIKEFDLPCLMQSTVYSFALAIHEHHDLQVEPECVLWIKYSQLPICRDADNEPVSEESAIERLVEIVYTPQNKHVLAWYGFLPLKDQPELYAY